MRERRRLIAIGFYLVSSILCVLLIAGHGPWSGQLLWEISLGHGLNTGDLPVLAVWGASLWMCWMLWRDA